MGQPWPQFPSDVQGGDDPTFSPAKGKECLLATEDGTQQTRRLVTDADRNLKVNIAAGSLTPSGTQDVRVVSDTDDLAKNTTLTDGTQKTQVTNFPASQAVTGPLTDTQLRAAPVPVAGPLTDTQLRASAVPISASTLPLPANAAQEGGGHLAAIDATTAEIATDTDNLALIKAKTDNLDVLLSTRTKPSDTQLVDGSAHTQPISAASLPLPSGASTEATLALIKAKTDNIDVALSTRTKPADTQLVDGSAHTQPISAASLPLPANAAQETGGNLASLNSKDFATQTTLAFIKAKTDNLDVLLSTRTKPSDTQLVDGSAHTQPISAAALPLPAGASTEATLATVAKASTQTDGTQKTQVTNFPATQAVTQGTSPWAISGPVTNTPPGYTLDLFGRNRISAPESLFASQFLYDKEPLLWDESLTTGGTSTFSSATSSIAMAVTTSSGSRVIRQTKEYFAYEPDRVQQIALTGKFGPGTANCKQMIGAFDDNNGVFLQMNGTTFGAVIRSSTSGSPADTVTSQGSFSIDHLDGTGPSGLTIDLTKVQLFIIEYQWFGIGTVRFGLYYNTQIYYFHQVFHANADTTVYMQRGSLPVRYEIVNTGVTSGATTLTQICCAVQSEAGYSPTGVNFSADTGSAGRTIAGSATLPMVSIRLKAANNRATIVPLTFDVLAAAANNSFYQIIINGTLTGASFNSVNANSYAEFDIAATAISGGTVIDSGYISSVSRQSINTAISSLLKVVANIAGTADILSLVLTSVSGGSATFYGSLSWQEYN